MPSRIFQQHLHVLKFETHIKGFLPLFQRSPIHVSNSLSHQSTVDTTNRNNGSLVISSYEKSEPQDYSGVNLWGLSHPAVVTFRSNSKTRWSLCFIPQRGVKERIKFILYHLFIKCFEVHWVHCGMRNIVTAYLCSVSDGQVSVQWISSEMVVLHRFILLDVLAFACLLSSKFLKVQVLWQLLGFGFFSY